MKIFMYSFVRLILLLLLFLIFAILTKGQLLSFSTITDLMNLIAIPLIIASGIHLIISMGGIDLSCEGIIALGGIILARVYSSKIGLLIFVIAILLGALLGLINGFLHVRFKAPSFIVTLGLSWVCEGLATTIAKGQSIPLSDSKLQNTMNSQVLGVPILFLTALFVWAIIYFLQKKTPLGIYLIGIGVNESLVQQSGIAVKKFKICMFVLAGALYGIAALLLMARLNSANVGLGNNLVFPSITAIVVGGISLSGGKGNAFNVIIGIIIIAILNMGLIMLKVNPYIQGAVTGIILISAILCTTSKHQLNFIK